MEGPPKPVVFDPPTPLRDSALWRLQRAFYETKGVNAWSEAIVPNFVTTNSFIARAYAKVILGLLRDTFEVPPTPSRRRGSAASTPAGVDPTKPVYIIEIGAGHGKLGYLIVETLLRYRAFFPPSAVPSGLPFKYVLTDAFPGMVEAWRAHPSLKDFFDMGALDVAVFDAERDREIRCLIGGEVLAPGAPACGNPMLAIANYALDSLTVDAFRITVPPPPSGPAGGKAGTGAPVLEQACVSVTSTAQEDRTPRGDAEAADAAAAPDAKPAQSGALSTPAASAAASVSAPSSASTVGLDPGLLSRMTLSWSYAPVRSGSTPAAPAVYGDPLLDSLLAAYLATPALTAPPSPAPPPPAHSHDGSQPVPSASSGGASIHVPIGGMRALRSLLAVSGGKLVALVGDKGYARLAEMQGHR